jgi:hypothetical protein
MNGSELVWTRRRFGWTLCGLPCALGAAPKNDFADGPWNAPARVARAYLAAAEPHWPKPTLDVAAEAAEVEKQMERVARKNAHNVTLTGGEILRTADEVKPWIAKQGEIDGVLLIPLSQPTPPLAAMVEALKVPAVFFSRPYATHAWSSIAAQRRAGKKIDVIATSSYGDLDPYMRAFKTVRHMKSSKVLVGVATPKARQTVGDLYTAHFGTTFQYVGGEALKDAFNSVDERAAKEEAAAFTRGALKVVEPSEKEIHDGLKFYLALKEMLRREKANALTIDCFGTLAAKTLPGYPCIAWSKFNDAGLYGVCEADIHSTMTQMLVTSYAGVPGFVSDPVFDESRNEVTHAHCVSATKMEGPDGPASPYILRRHLETNEGAVLQVLLPAGKTITVGRFADPRKFLVSTAEVTGLGDDDRGCRTQIRTRVKDAEKWLQNYQAGLHRVIFYGDHVRDIARMGRMMGFETAEEM